MTQQFPCNIVCSVQGNFSTFRVWSDFGLCLVLLHHLWNCRMCLIQLESVNWKFLVNGKCFKGMRSPPKGREGVTSQAIEWTLVVVLWRTAAVYMSAKFVSSQSGFDKTVASSKWGPFQIYWRLWNNSWTKIICRYSYFQMSFCFGMLKLWCKVSGDSSEKQQGFFPLERVGSFCI